MGVGRPAPRPGRHYPRERQGTHCTGGWVGRSGREENLVPTGIRSRTVQPVVSRHTDCATRPTTTRFNIQKFYIVITLNLCVLYGSRNKQQIVPYITLQDRFL